MRVGGGIGVSYAFCNKLSQMWLFKNSRNLFSHSSGAQKSEVKALTMLVLSRGSGGDFSPRLAPSVWWLPTILGIPWLVAAELQSLPHSLMALFSVCLLPPSSL